LANLKSFILADKSIADIIADFKAQFPAFSAITNSTLTTYINLSFNIIPNGFVNCGFDSAYDGYLFGLAHILVYNDVLTGGIPSLKKSVDSKTAGSLSISYQDNIPTKTPANTYNYFSTTNYGLTMLAMLDSCGLTNTCGGFIV